MTENKLPNHIEEYLDQKGGSSEFIELFEGKSDNIDLRTDLTFPEIPLVGAIIFNHDFLKKKNIPSPYGKFIDKYLRLKVSKDRQSRAEFVDVNKKERFENNLNKFNAIQQLKDVKA